MILKGFNVILVNPKGTTNSEAHDKVMREKGFDRHTASAYLIALKGLGMLNDIRFTAYRKLLATALEGSRSEKGSDLRGLLTFQPFRASSRPVLLSPIGVA